MRCLLSTLATCLLACGPWSDTTVLRVDLIAGCDAAQTTVLREAEDAAHAQLHEQQQELLSCLREYYLTATNGDSPEQIVRELQRGSFELHCEDLGPAHFKATAEIDQGDSAVIRVNPHFVDTAPHPAALTATLLHEWTHARGYRHGDGTPEWVDDPETPTNARTSNWYDYSVSQQVARCSAALSVSQYVVSTTELGDYAASEPNVPRGNFHARSDHQRGTFLAAIGRRPQQQGNGQTTWSESEVVCTEGFARGVVQHHSPELHSLELLCSTSDGQSTLSISSSADDAVLREPTTSQQACAPTEAMVGLAVHEGEQLLAVRPACQPLDAVQAGQLAERRVSSVPNSERWVYRWCPAGLVVKRLLLSRSNDEQPGIAGLRVECATVDQPSAGRPILPLASTSSDETVFRELCPTGSVVRVFEGRSQAEVDRLEGTCAEVELSDTEELQYPPGGGATSALEGHGGFGGAYSTDSADPDCPRGHALVGVERSADENGLIGLNGICAPLAAWSNEETAEQVELGWMGQPSNDSTEELCPPGRFVAGWDVTTGASPREPHTIVRGLQLHCADPR